MTTSDTEYYRLRTEWLRFKSHLQDRLTGLPTLPAVLEDVRRLLEAHGSVDVVYLDLGRSGGHEAKLGWAAYDEAVKSFARLLSSLRQAGDIGARDLMCLHTVRSDRFLLFLGGISDVPRSQAQEAAGTRKARLLDTLHARDRGPDGPGLMGPLQIATGHAHVHNDPMIRPERAIQQAVADAMLMSFTEREGIDAGRRQELARLIAERRVRTVFEPLVRLADGGVIGHEALTRPLGEVSFASVEDLFAFAESTDLILDFERLCRTTAVRSVASLPAPGLLFLNTSARAVEDPEWSGGGMDTALAGSGLSPSDVVVEITERVAITRRRAFLGTLRLFKERGYRVAVDDMGAGYASLQTLAAVEPDFLKFDVSLVRGIDQSRIKRGLLESLRNLAGKIHARVIAEGVEREEERLTLLSLGIELGQGYHFHREPPAS